MASVLAELPSNPFREAESRAGNKENVPIGCLASCSKDKCSGTRKRTATRTVAFFSSSQVPDYLTQTELEALANEEICGAIDERALELPQENLAIDTLFQPPCLAPMSTPQPNIKSKWLAISPLSLSSPPPPTKKMRLDDAYGHTPLDEYSTPHERDGSPVSVLGMRFSPGPSPSSPGNAEGWHSAYKGPTPGRARSRRARGIKRIWSSGVVSDMLAYPAGVEKCLEDQLFGEACEFQSYLNSDDDNSMDTDLEESMPLLLGDLPLTLSAECLDNDDELAQLQQHDARQIGDMSTSHLDSSASIPPSGSSLAPQSQELIREGEPGEQAKRTQKGSKKIRVSRPSSQAEAAPRSCTHCRATDTPQWRAGPQGPKTLCNACGVRYKSGRLCDEYRPANSPEYQPDKHSNSHRKIVEMRRIRETISEGQAAAEAAAKLSFRTIKVKLTKPQASETGEGEAGKHRVRKEKTEEERQREKELRKERKKLRMALLKQQQQQQEQKKQLISQQQQSTSPLPVASGSLSPNSFSPSSPLNHDQHMQHSCLAQLSVTSMPPARLPALPPAVFPTTSSPTAATASHSSMPNAGNGPAQDSNAAAPADGLGDVLQLLHDYAPESHCANQETLPDADILPVDVHSVDLLESLHEAAHVPPSTPLSTPTYLPSVCNMSQPPAASILAASA